MKFDGEVEFRLSYYCCVKFIDWGRQQQPQRVSDRFLLREPGANARRLITKLKLDAALKCIFVVLFAKSNRLPSLRICETSTEIT